MLLLLLLLLLSMFLLFLFLFNKCLYDTLGASIEFMWWCWVIYKTNLFDPLGSPLTKDII